MKTFINIVRYSQAHQDPFGTFTKTDLYCDVYYELEAHLNPSDDLPF